jgi:hypothetical protein
MPHASSFGVIAANYYWSDLFIIPRQYNVPDAHDEIAFTLCDGKAWGEGRVAATANADSTLAG